MGRGSRNSRGGGRRGCGCSLILLVALLVGLVAAAEFGVRWYLSDRAEKEVSAKIDAPASVSFGGGLLLWELLSTRSADTVHLTSPGSDTVPQLDVTASTVTLVDGAIHAAHVDGTAVLDEQQLVAAASQGEAAQNSPIAGMAEIRSVRPDPAAGLLRADIGGIAEIGVSPGVTDGQLTLRPEQTALLGFPLPDGLFAGITTVVDSTVAKLPDGMVIEGAQVVDQGLQVELGGQDVTLPQG
ncbi:DUF2993 domain-containing protein [Dietzia aerolata]|uniref:LmeA family phospholipid-binding protein n=1 Tax=Dietzia aerolata TaxID=595984 RepID=A0ABV5JRZ2_9ACTN|nr:LmeA family phospholipid-binding protein [Dietzia aerolata]MBB0968814.1 DUF2993 domain-containing protein [Dietzia aerolata]